MIRFLDIIFISILTFTIASQGLFAQNEDLENILNINVKDDDQSNIELEPDPLNLQSNWWMYFEDSKEQLDKKVDSFIVSLNELSKSVSDKHKEKSNEYITRIKASLKALIDIKKADAKTIPTEPFKELYTLDELLALNRSLRELEAIYKTELPVFKENQKTSKALSGKIDTLYASYKKIDVVNQDKLIKGLELIANRIAWFVSTQKEPIQKELLDYQDSKIKKLKNEIDFAKSNLSINENELETIKKEIDNHQSVLNLAQKDFVEAYSLSLESVEEDLTGYFKSSLLKQKSLLEKILSTNEEVKLNYLLTKELIILLSLQDTKKHADKFIKQYTSNESILKDVYTKSDEWHSSLLKEINSLIETNLGNDNAGDLQNTEQIAKDRSDIVKGVAQALQKLDNSLAD
ncbi:MAG: hypothetical protein P8X88_02150 [Gammaproteobacteria bacterium]